MKTILIVKTSSLGDVVHQMPAMTDMRRHHQDARIIWVVEEAFAPLARLHPAVDEVIAVATRRWRSRLLQSEIRREIAAVRARLKKQGSQIVVDTQGLIRSALIAREAPGVHHGYDSSSIKERLATLFYDVRHRVSRDLHAVVRNRTLTGLSLGYVPDQALDYGLVKPSANSAPPYAVLLHGTSRPAKEWRESEWIRLGKWLRDKDIEVLLLWGNERERLRCERLAGGIPGSRIIDRQPLDETAKVIAGASLVVGVDTGLLHLAAAYEVPLVAIFLSTEPGLTGPVGSGPIVILGGKDKAPAFDEVVRSVEANGAALFKA